MRATWALVVALAACPSLAADVTTALQPEAMDMGAAVMKHWLSLAQQAPAANMLQAQTAAEKFSASQNCAIKLPQFMQSVNMMCPNDGYVGPKGTTCNWECYIKRYPDLLLVNVQFAEQHYNDIGSAEGKDCTCDGEDDKVKAAQACHLLLQDLEELRIANIDGRCRQENSLSDINAMATVLSVCCP